MSVCFIELCLDWFAVFELLTLRVNSFLLARREFLEVSAFEESFPCSVELQLRRSSFSSLETVPDFPAALPTLDTELLLLIFEEFAFLLDCFVLLLRLLSGLSEISAN